MVAVRAEVEPFAAAVTVTELLLKPLAVENVSHEAEDVTFHVTLDVTLNVCEAPAAAKLSVVGETDSEGAAVTVTEQ